MIPIKDNIKTNTFPIITLLLILLNVTVYFLQPGGFLNKSGSDSILFLYEYTVIPCELLSGEPVKYNNTNQSLSCGEGEALYPEKNVYVSAIASLFMHGNLLHIVGNMLFLWVFGNNIEDRLGKIKFILFYVLSGLIAVVGHALFSGDSTIPLIGASGAVAGVMGAYFLLYPKAKILTIITVLLIFFVQLPARLVLGIWFILQFFTTSGDVAWIAHVAGFIFGVLVALLLKPEEPTDELTIDNQRN